MFLLAVNSARVLVCLGALCAGNLCALDIGQGDASLLIWKKNKKIQVLPTAKMLTGVCMHVSCGGILILLFNVTKPTSSFCIPKMYFMLPANLCYKAY